MAQIIKLHSRPQKYILRKKLNLMPSNYLIKSASDEKIIELNSILQTSRSVIFDYLGHKEQLIKEASARTIRRYKVCLATEVLWQTLQYRNHFKYEAQAIHRLAQKIAANIVHSPKLEKLDQIEADTELNTIEDWLIKSLIVEIHVPEKQLEYLMKKYEKLIQLWPTEFLRPHTHDTGAQICVMAFDLSFHLNVDENDIENILNKLLKNIKETA